MTFRPHGERWGQGLGYDVRGQYVIEGHACTGIGLWSHAYSLWLHSVTSPSNCFISCFDFHSLCAAAFLRGSQKSPRVLVNYHTTVILHLLEDKKLIYPTSRRYLPNISYLLIKSYFSNRLLYFDTPCIDWLLEKTAYYRVFKATGAYNLETSKHALKGAHNPLGQDGTIQKIWCCACITSHARTVTVFIEESARKLEKILEKRRT